MPDTPAPSAAPRHVAVIGAGIVGVATALELARGGTRVTLVDRDGPAAGASRGSGDVLAASAVVPVTVPGLMRAAPRLLMSRAGSLFLRWPYLPRLAPGLARYLSHANATVVTTGAWSGPLARRLGLDVPLETERGCHLELVAPSGRPRATLMVSAGKFVATPMERRLRLAGIVEFGVLRAAPRARPSSCCGGRLGVPSPTSGGRASASGWATAPPPPPRCPWSAPRRASRAPGSASGTTMSG